MVSRSAATNYSESAVDDNERQRKISRSLADMMKMKFGDVYELPLNGDYDEVGIRATAVISGHIVVQFDHPFNANCNFPLRGTARYWHQSVASIMTRI